MSRKKQKTIEIFFGRPPDEEKQILLQIFWKDENFRNKIAEAQSRYSGYDPTLEGLKSGDDLKKYKKIMKEVDSIILAYKLDPSWQSILTQLIINTANSSPPPTIALKGDIDKISIVIQGFIKTKNQIIEWVEENWPEIRKLVNRKFEKKLKRKPELDKIEYYQRIIELRDNKEGNRRLTFREITDKLIQEFPELNTESAAINEFSVKNSYHVYKQIFKSLQLNP